MVNQNREFISIIIEKYPTFAANIKTIINYGEKSLETL